MQLIQDKVYVLLPIILITFYSHIVFSQTQVGQSIFNENIGDVIGQRFDMSSNGKYLIVNNSISETQTKVITYQYNGMDWVRYGNSIIVPTTNFTPNAALHKISGDGNTISIVIIDKHPNGNPDLDGYIAIYAYSPVDDSWNLKGQKIYGNYPWRIDFEMSDDGNKFVVSQPREGSDFYFDKVITYSFQNNNWVKIHELKKQGSLFFGVYIDLSSDGNTLIVGDWGVDNSRGEIYAYKWNGTEWTENGSISGFEDSGFVALSKDGSTIGTVQYEYTGVAMEVLVFHRIGNTWTQKGNVIIDSNEGSINYNGIDFSHDGNRIVVGSEVLNSSRIYTTLYEYQDQSWDVVGSRITTIDPDNILAITSFSVYISNDGKIVSTGSFDADSQKYPDRISVFEFSETVSDGINFHQYYDVSPNPTSNFITIKQKKINAEKREIRIFNLEGKLLKLETLTDEISKSIDISDFANGIYVLSITASSGISSALITKVD